MIAGRRTRIFLCCYGTDIASFIIQIKEKEMMYKRYREESEAARMV